MFKALKWASNGATAKRNCDGLTKQNRVEREGIK